jgi:hypothetical protein
LVNIIVTPLCLDDHDRALDPVNDNVGSLSEEQVTELSVSMTSDDQQIEVTAVGKFKDGSTKGADFQLRGDSKPFSGK